MFIILSTLTKAMRKFQISYLTVAFIIVEWIKEFKVSGSHITITTDFIICQIHVKVRTHRHASSRF